MSETPLIDIQNLSIDFGSDEQQVSAVSNISFHINKGETFALVGESGSGKSVTALSILQLLPTNQTHYPNGSIHYKGQSLIGKSDKEMMSIRGNEVSIIFQEPMTSLNPLHTVEKQINEMLFLHKGLTKTQATERTIELLNLVCIKEPESRLNSYPHELSGGQRQRVMIAMALANEPELLIADEPTTALDVTIQKQILELLADLQQKLGMAILLISHDLGVVQHYSDRVAVMKQGKIVEQNSTKKLFKNPQHEYSQLLLSANPTGSPTPLVNNSQTLIEARDIRVWFPIKKGLFKKIVSHIKAVNGISLNIKQGETLGIVGESGSGKSTLGLALIKLVSFEGSIIFENNAIHTLNQREFRPLRRDIQIVFQDPFGSLNPRMSIKQIIEEGLLVHKIGDSISRDEQIQQMLIEVGMDPESRHRYPHEFSGGQRQRIAIARALVLKPKLIILDEPTSALDRTVQTQIIEILRDLQQRYQLSYIFISHDLAVVKAMSHRIMVMQNGEVIESGSTEDIFHNPQQQYTKTLLDAALN